MQDSTSVQHEKIFFKWIYKNPVYVRRVNSFYFNEEWIEIAFKLLKNYYKKWEELPSAKVLWETIQASQFQTKISPAQYKNLFTINLEDYNTEWIEKTFNTWLSSRTLEDSMSRAIDYIKNVEITEDNYTEAINTVKTIINDTNVSNFKFDAGLDFYDISHHIQREAKDKISTGFKILDQVLNGGLEPGTLSVMMGESNVGKSIFLANLAAAAFLCGKNVAFITAEMEDSKVMKRLGSNILNISMDEYDEWAASGRVGNKIKGLFGTGALFVKEYPTSLANTLDIEAYLKQLEEDKKMKIDFVVIDYINILADHRNPNSENTYLKIKNIAEDLRAIMQKGHYAGISVTQVNGSGLGSSDLQASDISESKALYHTVDNLFGIIQTAEMYEERVYWLKSLKLRDSGGKHMKIGMDINYDYMRIKENGEVLNQ